MTSDTAAPVTMRGAERNTNRGPGRPRAAKTEQAIFDAVLTLLADHGVSGVSIEGVASEAGVAKTTIYRRWDDKRALIIAALKEMKGPLPDPPGQSVRDDLFFLLKIFRDQHGDERACRIFPKIISKVDSDPELIHEFRTKVMDPRRETWRRVLRRGITEELIDPGIDLTLVTDLLISPMVTRRVTRHEEYDDEQLYRLIDIVLTGIAPATER